MSDQPEQSFGGFESSALSGGSTNAFVPIAVALGAAVVAIVALVITLSRSGPSAEVKTVMEQLRESNLTLQNRVVDLERKVASFGDGSDRASKNVQELAASTQTALNQVGVAITKTREQVASNSTQIAELVKTVNQWATRGSPTPTASTASSQPAASASRPAAPVGNVPAGATIEHTIEPGDTFSKLSGRYKISVSRILEANPNVDPRRMLPGQKIRIPAP